MNLKEIILDEKPPIAIISINRPKNLNALNVSAAKELLSVLQHCSDNEKIRTIVLTGTGKAFCAGGDVKEFKIAIDKGKPDEYISVLSDYIHKIVISIRTIPKPVIAAMNGFAMGAGLNIGLFCDIIFAADTAKLNEAFVNVGLSVDGGGSYILPKLIGKTRTLELLMAGKMVGAEEAKELGLINYVVPESELEKKTEEFALKLAKGPPKAIATIKKLVEESYLHDLKTQLDIERQNQIKISRTEDFKEGVTAFFEKRKPNYKGK